MQPSDDFNILSKKKKDYSKTLNTPKSEHELFYHYTHYINISLRGRVVVSTDKRFGRTRNGRKREESLNLGIAVETNYVETNMEVIW